MDKHYLTLYIIMDLILKHLEDNKLATFKNGDLKLIVPYSNIEKVQKKIIDDFDKIFLYLNNKVSKEKGEELKNKYKKILDALEDAVEFNEYATAPMAYSILSHYAKEHQKNPLKFHFKRAEKIMNLMKKDANIKYTQKYILNSLILGEKIYKLIKEI